MKGVDLHMDDIIFEYDNLLVGRTDEISLDYFNGIEPGGSNERTALCCIRYAIEKIIGWDEEDAVQRLDSYMLHSLKLDGLLRFIDFPPDLEFGDARYILSKLYPKRVKLNFQKLVINTLNDILDEKRSQFPRDYFVGSEGFKRYCYCIKYLLEVYMPFKDIKSLYQYFYSPNKTKFLDKFKLKVPSYQYKLDIIQAIMTITSDNPDSELYYNYFEFKKQCKSLGI